VRVADARSTVESVPRAYRVFARFALLHLFPSAGRFRGGTPVSIAGTGFSSHAGAVCRFGNETTPAKFVSSSMVACLPPPLHAAGPVVVSVSLNAVDFAPAGLEYVAGLLPVLTSLHPSEATEAGGVRVSIIGWNFNASHAAECAFGARHVVAEVVSSTLVACLAPQHPPAAVQLQLLINTAPLDDAGAFLYRPALLLRAVTPSSGLTTGGTTVTASGANFFAGVSVCRFGETATVAIHPTP
jgi:hypothetical protein